MVERKTNAYDVLNTLIMYVSLTIIMIIFCLIPISSNYSEIDEITININTNDEMTKVFKSLETISYNQYETVKESKNILNQKEIFLENIPKRNASYEIQTVQGKLEMESKINNYVESKEKVE